MAVLVALAVVVPVAVEGGVAVLVALAVVVPVAVEGGVAVLVALAVWVRSRSTAAWPCSSRWRCWCG